VPRDITKDIIVIENENSQGNVYKTKIRAQIFLKCFEILKDSSEI